MDILVRQQIAGSSSQAVFTDHALDVNRLRIGSAADADVQLSGNTIQPYHAEIHGNERKLTLVCSRGLKVSVNGSSARKFTLKTGDTIAIGEHSIEILEAPGGFDLALQLGISSASSVNFEDAYKTDLRQTHLKPRVLGWLLSLAVICIAMLVPLAYHFTSHSDTTDQQAGLNWLIDDTIWSSGPLHEAHASLDNSCKSCHVKLFQQVTNESCNVCHADTQDHIIDVAANEHLPIDMNGDCASCHREHNEPVSSLIISSNQLCTDCHNGHELQNGDTTLAQVAGFGESLHPEFNISLLHAPTKGSFATSDEWPIMRMPLSEAVENSQLKFNHEVHYDENKVVKGSGEPMACKDCHVLGVDGEHFAAIEFEMNCANSGCHELELDPRNRLPHGQPDIAIAAIEGFYLRKFGNPEATDSGNRVERRRRLDQSARTAKNCTENSWNCAMQLADAKIEQQFTKTGCVTCHTIEDSGGNVLDRYRIAVVKLNNDFFPTARFDHVSHGVLVEPGSPESHTGDQSCTYCHTATTSSESKDLLLPDIDNCTTCHNGPQRQLNAPLGCIDCHAYHSAS